MKIEIKKIAVKDVFFSAFPLAVFGVLLLTAIVEIFKPEATVSASYIFELLLFSVTGTLLFLVSAAVFLWIYNFLCGLGVRGVRVDLEDKE